MIDTSHLTLSQLNLILNKRLGLEKGSKLTLSILSFGFRNGLPNEADTIIEVRLLSHPHYNDELRSLDGRE